jgi:hypothetical protein
MDKLELRRIKKLRSVCATKGPKPADLVGWVTLSGISVCADCVSHLVQYNLAAPVRGGSPIYTYDKNSKNFTCDICTDIHDNN